MDSAPAAVVLLLLLPVFLKMFTIVSSWLSLSLSLILLNLIICMHVCECVCVDDFPQVRATERLTDGTDRLCLIKQTK